MLLITLFVTSLVMNPFEVLEINRTDSLQEIKEAYRGLSLRYHPDKNNHISSDHFISIQLAYDELKDPILRKKYVRYGYLFCVIRSIKRKDDWVLRIEQNIKIIKDDHSTLISILFTTILANSVLGAFRQNVSFAKKIARFMRKHYKLLFGLLCLYIRLGTNN